MSQPKLDIEQQSAEALAKGYSRWFRAVEVLSIATFWTLLGAIAWRTSSAVAERPLLAAAAFLTGYIFADFISGFVHWMADTWGSTDMPVLGKALLRPFREHHVDPKAMTKHDYIETNGANCLISLWVAALILFIPLNAEGFEWLGLFAAVSLTSMIFWVMMTNQFHKWSHVDADKLPAIVRWLQRNHLILPVDHHDVHHTAPFDTYYCITTGWLNWPLQKIGFYRVMEKLVTATTGLVPRKDDIGLKAALAIAPVKPGQKSADSQVDLARP